MAKAKKQAPKKKASADTESTTLEQVTTVEEPPVIDPERAPKTGPENMGFKERTDPDKPDPNSEPRGEDKVWDVATRDRWADGGATIHELNKDAALAEASAAEHRKE